MANRIVGNIIIVDSAMGNALLIEAATGNLRNIFVTTVGLWSTDTTGLLQLSLTNTADIIVKIQNPFQVPSTVSHRLDTFLENIKVPTITAGTGFIYFK